MQKKLRIASWAIISFFSMITIMCIMFGKSHKTEHHIEKETDKSMSAIIEGMDSHTVAKPMETPTEPITEEPTTKDLVSQMNDEIANIPYDFNDMNQKQDWFVAYKAILDKYPKEFHPQTIYEAFDAKELDLLFRIVQCEVGDEWDFDEKANVVSVIFNRLYSGRYTSLTNVLTAPKQFSPYLSGKYKSAVIDEKTILACEYVFIFGDTTNGCYGFQMKKQDVWNGWTYQFSDDTHHFYKKTN